MEEREKIVLLILLAIVIIEFAAIARFFSPSKYVVETDQTEFSYIVMDAKNGGEFYWNGERYIVIDD